MGTLCKNCPFKNTTKEEGRCTELFIKKFHNSCVTYDIVESFLDEVCDFVETKKKDLKETPIVEETIEETIDNNVKEDVVEPIVEKKIETKKVTIKKSSTIKSTQKSKIKKETKIKKDDKDIVNS